jgi:hypothetical protein
LERTPNYTALAEPARFETGYIGELCFRNGLALSGYRYEYRAYPFGKRDRSGSDIFVWLKNGERLSVNVKTASEKRRRMAMMVPEAQFRIYRADIYVGARIEGDWCDFKGWLTHDELAKRPVEQIKIPTRCCAYTDLHEIDKLLERLQKE